MALAFDHAVVAVRDLESAIDHYRGLGLTTVRGGVHANRATHNALIVFPSGTYIELLARTGETAVAGLVDFSRVLDRGEGVVGFALRSDDLGTDAARLHAAGIAVGEVFPGERLRTDGTLVQWKLALVEDGFAPFLIQDMTPRERRISTDPALITHANGARRVQEVQAVMGTLTKLWENWNQRLHRAGLPTQEFSEA